MTCAPNPPIGAFLDRDEQLMLARQLEDELAIERLGKACIGHCRRNSVSREHFRGFGAFSQPRAQRKQGHRIALLDDAAFADFERHAGLRHCDANAVAAGIADRAGAIVYRRSRRNHMDEFGLICRGHQDEIRQTAEVGEVKRAGMGRPVGADQTCTIHHEPDG